MKVYKFGGASLKDARRIENLLKILKTEQTEGLVLVVSAMGKTTNKLEKVLETFLQQGVYGELLEALQQEFLDTAKELFPQPEAIFSDIERDFQEIADSLQKHKNESYNFLYDQIVAWGELITSKLLSAYLNQKGLNNTLLDAREYVQTDSTYRDAVVNWEQTCENIQQLSGQKKFFITQGFIAGDNSGNTTTLGREGSDYSAAIFAYCLDATELIIWKDMKGVLNADPRHFKHTILLEHISFNEAIELAYYGASIIHPKTIQPLHRKNIPLKVRSFLNPKGVGTQISCGQRLVPDIPCYILKTKQHLLQISSKEFSFIMENDISDIFRILSDTQMKVNLLHNSAISMSLCIDDRLGDIAECIALLKRKHNVTHRKNVTLYTIRNYCEKDFQKRFGKITPILRQSKDDVVHIITDTYED